MVHYDLYGNSYRTSQEALNAEMAQCAEIDARIANEKLQQLEDEQLRQYEAEYEKDQKIEYLMSKIEELEKRIEKLERTDKIL